MISNRTLIIIGCTMLGALLLRTELRMDKVEDKFVEHCNDITGQDCTAQEKANFITYLITVKEPSKKAKAK